MKVKMNCYVKTDKYGLLEGGKTYDLESDDAMALLSKSIDHQRKQAELVDAGEDKPAIKKNRLRGLQKKFQTEQARLKTKEKLIETNAKNKTEMKKAIDQMSEEWLALDELKKEIKELENG